MALGAAEGICRSTLLAFVSVAALCLPISIVESGNTLRNDRDRPAGLSSGMVPQQKQLLVVPLADNVLPIHPGLVGDPSRTALGDTMVAGRSARLFHVETERQGHIERFYESVDEETGIVLKLVSQDRDWSFEYERMRISPQPSVYFDQPPGYRKRLSTPATGERAH